MKTDYTKRDNRSTSPETTWYRIRELGRGGQGVSYKVVDRNILDLPSFYRNFLEKGKSYFRGAVSSTNEAEEKLWSVLDFHIKSILSIDKSQTPIFGAQKILLPISDAKDPEKAEARLRKEIDAMSAIKNPNALELLDVDPDYKWYVSRFYSRGSLEQNLLIYKGDVLGSLYAVRPLVEALAEIHAKQFVHRDIKPGNLFVDQNNELVLGDFGLVWGGNLDNRSRISGTLENVGTRDFMPGWAQGCFLEDVSPAFDVFALGKILWCMVAGEQFLPLWYFHKSQYDLLVRYPKRSDIVHLYDLLDRCIVEHEADTLRDGSSLLIALDETIAQIQRDPILIDSKSTMRCALCAKGIYELKADVGNTTALHNVLGIAPVGAKGWKVFSCTYCGNLQMFLFPDVITKGALPPPAWR